MIIVLHRSLLLDLLQHACHTLALSALTLSMQSLSWGLHMQERNSEKCRVQQLLDTQVQSSESVNL